MEYSFASRMNGLKASAIREILKATSNPDVISFAAGNPAPEAFPVDAIREITDRILRENPIGALQYSISEGYTPLRDVVKSDLKTRLNIGRDFDELIILSGAQQSNDLCCKVFCNPGDTLLCESPSFIGSLNAFKSYEVNLVGIPMEDDGISIEKLEQAVKENKNIKMLYVIPNFQNPSGVTMSLNKRKAVYEICKKNHIMILEDNPYGELRFQGEALPSIKSMDTEGIVLYSGTFSKVVAPGIRVGCLCAPKEVIQKVVIEKQVNDVHTNIWAQMVCYEFMVKYDFPKHLKRLCEIYRHKSELMLSEMKKHFDPRITYVEPEGGLFIWCKLPDDADMLSFCKNAVEHKVAIVPGTAFLTSENETTQCFRLNYSTPTDEEIKKGIEILGKLTYQL